MKKSICIFFSILLCCELLYGVSPYISFSKNMASAQKAVDAKLIHKACFHFGQMITLTFMVQHKLMDFSHLSEQDRNIVRSEHFKKFSTFIPVLVGECDTMRSKPDPGHEKLSELFTEAQARFNKAKLE